MSLAYRATPAAGAGSSGAATVAKQSGTAARDVIFIFLNATTVNAIGTVSCTGFTAVSTSGGFGGLLYRVADGTEGTTFSVSTSASVSFRWLITTVSGSGGTDTVGSLFTSGTSGNSIAVPGVTVAGSGEWCLVFAAVETGNPTPSLTGFTVQSSAGASIWVLDNESIASGATGTLTVSLGTSLANRSGIAAALLPPVPPPVSTGQLVTTQAVKRASYF